MPAQQHWLTTMWPRVRSHLPPPPARVIEIGCGRLGGFVPMLVEGGYDAVGIDPAAPDGERYLQSRFEQTQVAGELDAVIACTSLHHVADPGQVLDRVARVLRSAGRVVVIEWDWENFDEASARWCFDRLGPADADSWISRRRQDWIASGRPWEDCFFGWARQHGLHGAQRLVQELDERFQRLHYEPGPYFFAELSETSEQDELSAIRTGLIRPARIEYVGQVPTDDGAPG